MWKQYTQTHLMEDAWNIVSNNSQVGTNILDKGSMGIKIYL